MMKRVTPKEYEILSAYIDNQLNPRERRRLESQLQNRSELRLALQQLRRTRTILQQTPRVRRPRSFTLTPGMVDAQPSRPRAYPAFQLAFALASVLFLVLFTGDLVGNSVARLTRGQPAVFEPLAVQEEPVELAAESAESAAGDAAAEAESQAPAAEAGGGEVVVEEALEVSPAEDSMEEAAPGTTEERLSPPTQAAVEAMTEAAEDSVFTMQETASPPPAPTVSPSPTVPPAPAAEPADSDLERTAEPERLLGQQLLTVLRVAEIMLLVIALLAGLGLILMRRR